jgi:hypothetical protein
MSGAPAGEALVAALPEPLAGAAADGTAAVTEHEVAGMPAGTVWRVRLEDPMHPAQVYVGRWPDASLRVLTDDQPAFLDLAASSGARVDRPDVAVGYVRGFLEATRGPAVRVVPVDDADRIQWRPGTPEEEERRRAVLDDPRLGPPHAEPAGSGVRVELCLVVDQRIQRTTFDVSPDGRVEASYVVLAEDLPLPIVR